MSVEARLELQAASAGGGTALEQDRVTLGRAGADIDLDDRTVSILHAVIERVTGGWVLQDLGSRNGTFVNGSRINGPRALRSGDEIRLGSSRILFRSGAPGPQEVSSTEPLEAAPQLTPRERDLLISLCRPLLQGSVLNEPASIRTIAAELLVSESAVKKLLGRTFDKFDLQQDDRRRPRLALEALRRGAVSLGDVAEPRRP